jgi:hypothetical protein
MPVSHQNKIGQRTEKEQVTLSETLHDTWRVMKPFVHFSIKAMKIIVKHIPKPGEPEPASKKNKVIKLS